MGSNLMLPPKIYFGTALTPFSCIEQSALLVLIVGGVGWGGERVRQEMVEEKQIICHLTCTKIVHN